MVVDVVPDLREAQERLEGLQLDLPAAAALEPVDDFRDGVLVDVLLKEAAEGVVDQAPLHAVEPQLSDVLGVLAGGRGTHQQLLTNQSRFMADLFITHSVAIPSQLRKLLQFAPFVFVRKRDELPRALNSPHELRITLQHRQPLLHHNLGRVEDGLGKSTVLQSVHVQQLRKALTVFENVRQMLD